jgi:shikimate 5-dehydrogenase
MVVLGAGGAARAIVTELAGARHRQTRDLLPARAPRSRTGRRHVCRRTGRRR